jgi:hypothetical protein
MLSLADAAFAAGLSYQQVWRLCLRGDVQGHREGRSWRVSASSMAAYLDRAIGESPESRNPAGGTVDA